MIAKKPTTAHRGIHPARSPIFYGWIILFWGTVGVLLSVPGQTTGVSAFIEPLLNTLTINRFELSLAYLIGTLTSAFFLTPAGSLFDRIGARWMGTASCLLLGIVLLLLSQTHHIAVACAPLIPEKWTAFGFLSVLFFLLRLSGQGVLTMASRNMIMKWFELHRGLVSGISGAAISIGFSLAPTCFNQLIQLQGWSQTWLTSGLFLILLFAPLLWIFFRDNPEEFGLFPDGKPPVTTHRKKPAVHHDFTLKEALKTIPFWAFTVTLSMHALIITAVTFNIESIFTAAQMKSTAGFALLPPMAITALIITLLSGWLCDRTPLRLFLGIMLTASFINLIGLLFLKPGWPIYCIVIGSGTANGLFGLLMGVTWPRYFGRKHLGAISSLSMSFIVVSSAIGPAFLNGVLSLTHSYTVSYLICLGFITALFPSLLFANNPQRRKARLY